MYHSTLHGLSIVWTRRGTASEVRVDYVHVLLCCVTSIPVCMFAHPWSVGHYYLSMVQSLLSPLVNVNLLRFDVSFAIKGKLLDSAIGRAAHIQFLDNPTFVRVFVHAYSDLLFK